MLPGIYNHWPIEQYHKDRSAITKSKLDLIHQSPAHYAQNLGPAESPALRIGSATHALILEPDTFYDHFFIVPPRMDKQGRRYQALMKTHANKTELTPNEYALVEQLRDCFFSNREAVKILEQALAIEQTIVSENFETGVLCKCRPDLRIPGALFDLKTVESFSLFKHHAKKFRYYVQAAFYLDLCREQSLNVNQFGFIVLSSSRPYVCTVYQNTHPKLLTRGRQEYLADLTTFKNARDRDHWPGAPLTIEVLEF